MQDPVNIDLYLSDPLSTVAIQECERVAQLLHQYGAIAIRDPRVTFEDNATFIDQVEHYFGQDDEVKMVDAFPEHHYQIGVTPEGTEVPGCSSDPECLDYIDQLEELNKPIIPSKADVKWRFFHKMGKKPEHTAYESLNLAPVVPENFPNWIEVMNRWGGLMLGCAMTIAEMAAVGLGLEKDAFTSRMEYGQHLLAPTATNLEKYGQLGTVMAGFHQDLNFMTFHGKSRFSGLNIWLLDDTKMPVSIPDGCLLAQAGMQIEHLTGGYIRAGYHEVVVNERTLEQIEKAKENGSSLWRVSSTVFTHISSDEMLTQLYGTEEEKEAARQKYPDITAGEHVERVLTKIALKKA